MMTVEEHQAAIRAIDPYATGQNVLDRSLAAYAAAMARDWLEDCGLRTSGMDAVRVMRTVHWNVEGGWTGFIASDSELQPEAVHAALCTVHGEAFASELQRR